MGVAPPISGQPADRRCAHRGHFQPPDGPRLVEVAQAIAHQLQQVNPLLVAKMRVTGSD